MKTSARVASISIALILISWIFEIFIPYDNTDDVGKQKRSGMGLYTDNLTGCQYLSNGMFSALTPRLNNKNEQVGCK